MIYEGFVGTYCEEKAMEANQLIYQYEPLPSKIVPGNMQIECPGHGFSALQLLLGVRAIDESALSAYMWEMMVCCLFFEVREARPAQHVYARACVCHTCICMHLDKQEN